MRVFSILSLLVFCFVSTVFGDTDSDAIWSRLSSAQCRGWSLATVFPTPKEGVLFPNVDRSVLDKLDRKTKLALEECVKEIEITWDAQSQTLEKMLSEKKESSEIDRFLLICGKESLEKEVDAVGKLSEKLTNEELAILAKVMLSKGIGYMRSPILQDYLMVPPKQMERIRSIHAATEKKLESAMAVSTGSSREAREARMKELKSIAGTMVAQSVANLSDQQLEEFLKLLPKTLSVSEFLASLGPECQKEFDLERKRKD